MEHEKTPCLPSSLGATMIHPPKHTHTRRHAPGINAITRAQFFTRLTGGGVEITPFSLEVSSLPFFVLSFFHACVDDGALGFFSGSSSSCFSRDFEIKACFDFGSSEDKLFIFNLKGTTGVKPPQDDFLLKETKPHLGGGEDTGDKLSSTYDLVEQMQYLYVRVVKAKDLPGKDVTGSCDPYAEVKLGNYRGTTRHFEKKSNPEWNQVFAFSKERIQASMLEVTVKDKDLVKDDFIGRVLFDMNEIPKRVPPDSPLAPQWYRLEDRKGEKFKGELMLAVWMGTQADEAFPEAWHSDAATVGGSDSLSNIRSKVYLSPKLWYLRVNVIEAQDLVPSDKGRYPEVYVKAILGNQVLRTRVSPSRSINPMWNEDLMFVASEPFDEPLILSVEDRIAPGKDEWHNLEKHVVLEGEKKKELKFASRIHMRICLEGGYHVLDESTHYSSDLRPTAKQLWKHSIGVLELGILSAQGLTPMKTKDGRGTTDAYCVAKYGQKWVRTRTIIDSFTPKWNEQYTWEVFDPCTVITIGVFDNCHLHEGENPGGPRDSRIGKVRIRLSTLESERVYTHSYPLLVLHHNGVKKMGEIHLAVRFTCSSLVNMMHMYSIPLLPKMHYIHPLTVSQLDNLRHKATLIVSTRLSRSEPPLRKEVVEYMLDVGSHMWSMRRSKANFFRIMNVFGGLIAIGKWFDQICNWKNPITTLLIHILFIILVLYPELILPTIFLYLFLIGLWYYRWRPRHPPHMDTRLSHADFPSSRPPDIVRMRYDRLRSIAGKIQTVVGDLATQGERLQSLLSWRDPRATACSYIPGSATNFLQFHSISSGGCQQELIRCCERSQFYLQFAFSI
uniref:C2 domain-containing protein n=1 Tax=Salix viminalis TaxID=40686 RepID=A0A6N2K6D3_SALVM